MAVATAKRQQQLAAEIAKRRIAMDPAAPFSWRELYDAVLGSQRKSGSKK